MTEQNTADLAKKESDRAQRRLIEQIVVNYESSIAQTDNAITLILSMISEIRLHLTHIEVRDVDSTMMRNVIASASTLSEINTNLAEKYKMTSDVVLITPAKEAVNILQETIERHGEDDNFTKKELVELGNQLNGAILRYQELLELLNQKKNEALAQIGKTTTQS